MFKFATSKFPALFLALAACFMTASGPVRLAIVSQGAESEITNQLEGKEFCHQKFGSRRLHSKHHQRPLHIPLLLSELPKLPVLEAFHQEPLCFLQSLPPLLRAPPAA
jgi:hypothetical protein